MSESIKDSGKSDIDILERSTSQDTLRKPLNSSQKSSLASQENNKGKTCDSSDSIVVSLDRTKQCSQDSSSRVTENSDMSSVIDTNKQDEVSLTIATPANFKIKSWVENPVASSSSKSDPQTRSKKYTYGNAFEDFVHSKSENPKDAHKQQSDNKSDNKIKVESFVPGEGLPDKMMDYIEECNDDSTAKRDLSKGIADSNPSNDASDKKESEENRVTVEVYSNETDPPSGSTTEPLVVMDVVAALNQQTEGSELLSNLFETAILSSLE